jgi:hypothetical protein
MDDNLRLPLLIVLPMPLATTFEATATRADLLRALERAAAPGKVETAGDTLRGEGWSLRLTALPALSAGLLRLARHRVDIDLAAMDAQAAQTFMDRLELHLRRGGG